MVVWYGGTLRLTERSATNVPMQCKIIPSERRDGRSKKKSNLRPIQVSKLAAASCCRSALIVQ
jgi:hypothetical protein